MPLPSRVSDLTGFDLLLSVARAGSIGRAAAEHGISQPAASARFFEEALRAVPATGLSFRSAACRWAAVASASVPT